MISFRTASCAAIAALLAGCAAPHAGTPSSGGPIPVTDAYLTPARVDLGRQEYGPGYERFPPVMTARTAYPTQEQANTALRRSRWGTVPVRSLVTKSGIKTITVPVDVPDATAAEVRLFACRPGGLDGVTGRVNRYAGPVVVCASDLLDQGGRVLARVPLNFYYWHSAWRLQDPRPGYSAVPWAEAEPSPQRSKGWFGDRY